MRSALPPARGEAGRPHLQRRKGDRRPQVAVVRIGRLLGNWIWRLQRHLRIGIRARAPPVQHGERRRLQIDWSETLSQPLQLQPHRGAAIGWASQLLEDAAPCSGLTHVACFFLMFGLCCVSLRAEQPPIALELCELPACVAKLYPGYWQVMYDACSATRCGETGKRKKWFRCSTGTYSDCDPEGRTQKTESRCRRTVQGSRLGGPF